jgi:adsorption protein B
MSVPRSVVNNFINFFAVCRAWKIFVIYLATGKAIAWDKTIHTFPVSAMATSSRSRIGDLLVQSGMITPEQRDDALARQQTTGMRLGQVLLADSLVSDQVLADAIAEQAAVPRVSLNALNFNPIGESVSRELILRHQIVPFSTGEDRALNVAVASLPDAAATHEISTATGRKIAYFIACDGEIDASLALLARRMPVLTEVR